jgi:alpha-D-xyloside xylohydrolase
MNLHPHEVSLEIDGGRLVLRPLLDNAIRVRFTRDAVPEPASLILTEPTPAPGFTTNESPDALVIATSRMQARVDRANGAITFLDAAGRVFLRETPGSRVVRAADLHGEPTWEVAQCFDSPPEERLFGTGQFQDGYLNIRDLPRRLTQVNTQIAIPIIVSSRGFGLLWHNCGLVEYNPANHPVPLSASGELGAAKVVEVTTPDGTKTEVRQDQSFIGEFTVDAPGRHAFFLDVGQVMARFWHVAIDGQVVIDFSNYWLPPTTSWFMDLAVGAHTVTITGEKNDRPRLAFRPARTITEFRSPVADALDYVVMAGRGDEITAAYRQLTGPVPLMPRWALGYIHCRERYKTQAELLENAAEFRARGLPLDVIVQDWQYWGRHGWNAMRFDEADYPDPAAMIRDLHAQHTRLMVSVWSKIDPTSELGREFVARGYFIPGTQWVDFFNPDAARFYWENFSAKLLSLGIDSWWQDATEPENDDLVGRRTHAGAGERLRNYYPLLVSRTVYEGQRADAPDRRVFILTRSAFLGQQRYASATWSGDVGHDWDALRRQITAGLNYVVTGLPWWTTDTGGFFRPGSDQYQDTGYHERFLRWLQYSTFTPLQRVHGYQTDTEPWRYGARVEAESRRWLTFRSRLLPYLYSEAARVSFNGSTLMRPLVMDFPDDASALDQDHEFMFGPALLVAPVLSPGATRWNVYLPAHAPGWFDFWTGEWSAGGQVADANAPLEQIPLHARAGSILPLGPELQHTGEKQADPIELRIYPGADADYALYEDEGGNYAYEQGIHAFIPLHWDEVAQTLVINAREGAFPGMLTQRTFHVTWVRAGHGVGDQATTPDSIACYNGNSLILPRPPAGRSS